MIYTDLTIKAMNLAYAAHHGQFDKGGVPYIFHPIHLAEEMDDEVSTCVALLHDTVEDTAVTLEELAESFPREIVEAVDLLTHREGVEYFDYVRSIRANPVAVKVKLADLAAQGVAYESFNRLHPNEAGMTTFAEAWRKNLKGEI